MVNGNCEWVRIKFGFFLLALCLDESKERNDLISYLVGWIALDFKQVLTFFTKQKCRFRFSCVFFYCFLLNELMMLFDCCFKITQYKTHVHRSITITHSLNQVQSEFNSSAILQRKAWKMYHQFSDQFNNFVSRIKSKRLLCRHPTTEPSKSNRFVLPVDILRQKCFTCKMKNKIKSYLS